MFSTALSFHCYYYSSILLLHAACSVRYSLSVSLLFASCCCDSELVRLLSYCSPCLCAMLSAAIRIFGCVNEMEEKEREHFQTLIEQSVCCFATFCELTLAEVLKFQHMSCIFNKAPFELYTSTF